MGYAHQDSTITRLQKETLSALDKTRKSNYEKLSLLWDSYRGRLQITIMRFYHQVAANKNWTYRDFGRIRGPLAISVRSLLSAFHAESIPLVKRAQKKIYEQSVLMHAWALDQVTPPNVKIKAPSLPMREAVVIRGPDDFEARWTTWMDAYNSALVHNLTLNALNEGPLEDAVDEVDATRANTPAYTLIDALNRIYDWEAMNAISEGASDIAGMNGEALEEEIWQTRGDLRVCDECNDNIGLSVEETGYPPLHPNCNCFTQLVPKSYAELLRSGDLDDRALADQMMRDGVAPNALIIRNENGEITSKAIVDFDQWTEEQGNVISGSR